jgi:hypothetical protein
VLDSGRSDDVDWRCSGLGNTTVNYVGGSRYQLYEAGGADRAVYPKLAGFGEAGVGARSAAAEGAVAGMAETPSGRLDVGPGLLRRAVLMVSQRVQARQAGAGRQEDCQQEGRPGPEEERAPRRARGMHEVEYTQTS